MKLKQFPNRVIRSVYLKSIFIFFSLTSQSFAIDTAELINVIHSQQESLSSMIDSEEDIIDYFSSLKEGSSRRKKFIKKLQLSYSVLPDAETIKRLIDQTINSAEWYRDFNRNYLQELDTLAISVEDIEKLSLENVKFQVSQIFDKLLIHRINTLESRLSAILANKKGDRIGIPNTFPGSVKKNTLYNKYVAEIATHRFRKYESFLVSFFPFISEVYLSWQSLTQLEGDPYLSLILKRKEGVELFDPDTAAMFLAKPDFSKLCRVPAFSKLLELQVALGEVNIDCSLISCFKSYFNKVRIAPISGVLSESHRIVMEKVLMEKRSKNPVPFYDSLLNHRYPYLELKYYYGLSTQMIEALNLTPSVPSPVSRLPVLDDELSVYQEETLQNETKMDSCEKRFDHEEDEEQSQSSSEVEVDTDLTQVQSESTVHNFDEQENMLDSSLETDEDYQPWLKFSKKKQESKCMSVSMHLDSCSSCLSTQGSLGRPVSKSTEDFILRLFKQDKYKRDRVSITWSKMVQAYTNLKQVFDGCSSSNSGPISIDGSEYRFEAMNQDGVIQRVKIDRPHGRRLIGDHLGPKIVKRIQDAWNRFGWTPERILGVY